MSNAENIHRLFNELHKLLQEEVAESVYDSGNGESGPMIHFDRELKDIADRVDAAHHDFANHELEGIA